MQVRREEREEREEKRRKEEKKEKKKKKEKKGELGKRYRVLCFSSFFFFRGFVQNGSGSIVCRSHYENGRKGNQLL